MMQPMVVNFNRRGVHLSSKALQILCNESFLAHPYKQCRESAARLLSLILEVSADSDAESGLAGAMQQQISGLFRNLIAELPSLPIPETESLEKDSSECWLESLLLLLLHTMYSNDAAISLRALLPDLLPCALGMISVRDKELSIQAVSCAAGLAHLPAHASTVAAMLTALRSVFADTAWRVRRNALLTLQDFVFTNLFMMSAEQREDALALACEALTDEVVEVREQAGTTASGIFRCLDKSTILSTYQDRFGEPCRKKRKKITKKSTVTVHGAVLGLVALLQTRPYDLPEWAPAVLGLLASRSGDPEPVASTVRKAFMEFWRTHQDAWQDIKQHLAEDEIDLLESYRGHLSYFS